MDETVDAQIAMDENSIVVNCGFTHRTIRPFRNLSNLPGLYNLGDLSVGNERGTKGWDIV